MNWKIMSKARSDKSRKCSRSCRYRPTLEIFEERQLLSLTTSLFVVDQAASALALSGTIAGVSLQQQGDGSLTSSYSGAIIADWDLDGLTINFDQPGTNLNAAVTGNWQPKPDGTLGSAPADYGGKITVLLLTAQIALRNLTLATSTASSLPLSGAGPYNFLSSESFTVLKGEADYNAGAVGTGSADLSTLSAQNASLDASTFEDLGNGSYRITLPVHLTIQETIDNLPARLHIDGQIVATAVLPVVSLSDGTSSSFDYATNAVAGGGPVAISDPAATVIYAPPGNLTSMTVTLINHPDGMAEFLGYDLDDSGLTTNGYDPTTGQLVITGSADPSVYQNILRTITYENDSLTPDTSDRQIQVVVSDGTNTSVVRTATIHISAPAAPSGPARLFVLGLGMQSEESIPVPGSVPNLLHPTHTDLIMTDLAQSPKPTGDDLATTLATLPGGGTAGYEISAFHKSGGEICAPFDNLLTLETQAGEFPTR
jgi:hypothetical protein